MGDQHRRPRRLTLTACLLAVISLGAACSGDSTKPGNSASRSSSDQVVVASFNFPESELLAEIYAQALTAAGVPVRVQLDLGTRELVLPAFQQGFVDLVPEYVGSALQAVAPGNIDDMGSPSLMAARLSAALARWGGRVLSPSPADDQNGFAVTSALAEKYGLRALSDLRKVDGGLVLAGPPECPSRPYCLMGLQRSYGLHFRQFIALDSPAERVAALHQAVANVALVFSTDADLANGELVFLADDRHLQPADNITPMVRDVTVARYGGRLIRALDAVSARLTTSELVFLNWRVEVAGRNAAAEAHGWLVRQGLAPRRS
jgi:osmoprotectant transport system substrate-binding protein